MQVFFVGRQACYAPDRSVCFPALIPSAGPIPTAFHDDDHFNELIAKRNIDAMFKSYKTTLTFVTLLLFALVLSAEAKAHAQVSRHDHANLNRFIRKRVSLGDISASGAEAGGQQATSTAATTASSAAATQSSAPASVSDAADTTATTSAAKTSTTDLLSSALSALTASSSASSSSSTAASSSSPSSSSSSTSTSTSTTSTAVTTTSPTSTTPEATPTPTVNVQQETDADTSSGHSRSTKTATVDAVVSASSTTAPQTSGTTSTSSGTALTVIIAVAASIGFVIVLWTIFRKWKLARSSKFDQRLNPIDWQPTNDMDGPEVPAAHRRANSDTSSFHSGAHHGGYSAHSSESGHGVAPSLQPLPDHDFTAGTAGGYNAGYGDYADLNRGASMNRGNTPQPPMQELARGPSLSRTDYGAGVPIHHQTGYGATDAYNSGNTGVRY